jgi:hypothetical protein
LKKQHLYGCRAFTYWFDEEWQPLLFVAFAKEIVTEMYAMIIA